MNPVVTIIANPVNVLLSSPTINVQLGSAGPQGATGPGGGGGGSDTWGSITGTLSSQTDLQTALNAKANTSSLATVATSGAYNDLSGKPTLGTAASHAATDFATATTMVNGHALSSSVTVTASDVGAAGTTGSGASGTWSIGISGNAATATALQAARTINGVSFDGTANITVAAAAGTLTGAALASGVTASSLTSLGTLASLLTANAGMYQSGGALESIVYSNGSSGTSKTIAWDNGNLQSVTITGAVTLGMTAPTHPGKFTLIVTQDGTGHVYGLSGVKWPGGTAPAYSTAASKIDVISIIYDGSNYYGMGGIAFA